jgi:hypothetical protein
MQKQNDTFVTRWFAAMDNRGPKHGYKHYVNIFSPKVRLGNDGVINNNRKDELVVYYEALRRYRDNNNR